MAIVQLWPLPSPPFQGPRSPVFSSHHKLLLLQPSPLKGTYRAGGLRELKHEIKQLLDGKRFGNFRLHLLLNLILSSDAHYARDGISCGLPSAPYTSRRQPASRLLLPSLPAHEWHNEATQQALGAPGQEGPAWTPWHPQAQPLPPTPLGWKLGVYQSQPLYIHSQLWPQFRPSSPPTPTGSLPGPSLLQYPSHSAYRPCGPQLPP